MLFPFTLILIVLIKVYIDITLLFLETNNFIVSGWSLILFNFLLEFHYILFKAHTVSHLWWYFNTDIFIVLRLIWLFLNTWIKYFIIFYFHIKICSHFDIFLFIEDICLFFKFTFNHRLRFIWTAYIAFLNLAFFNIVLIFYFYNLEFDVAFAIS